MNGKNIRECVPLAPQQNGSSLLELMVVPAIFGILIGGGVHSCAQIVKVFQSIELRGQKNDLRRYADAFTACKTAFFYLDECKNGKPLKLKDSKGKILDTVSGEKIQFSKLSAEVSCKTVDNSFQFFGKMYEIEKETASDLFPTPKVCPIDESLFHPDYGACDALPTSGKRGYGTCPANQVVVIINDGSDPEMTCCPLKLDVLLTKDPSKTNVRRSGFCLANEVLTGMAAPNAELYCTALNENYFKITNLQNSIYVNRSVRGVMGNIADQYHKNDTCICPEKTIALEGHSPADNVCSDLCGQISLNY